MHQAQMARRNVFTRQQTDQGKWLQNAWMEMQQLEGDLVTYNTQLRQINIIRNQTTIALLATHRNLQQQQSVMMTRQRARFVKSHQQQNMEVVKLTNSLNSGRIEMFEHFRADWFRVGEECCCLEDVRIGMHLVRLDCNNVLCINCIL